jgi:hypothetical protein
MQLSRYSTLASWSYTFFERGVSEYNRTQTEIVVSGLGASAQQRTAIMNPRIKYARTAFEYYATLYAIYAGPAGSCRPEVRRAIALAMSLPGFRKALMREDGPLTIFLPVSEDASSILDFIYGLGDPQHAVKFLLMHVIPGRLMLKVGQSFVFERAAGQPAYRPRFRIIDPELALCLSDAVIGRIASLPAYLTDDLVAYTATIQYGAAPDLVQKLTGQVPN